MVLPFDLLLSDPKKLSPYRIPITLQEEVDREISELLEQGLIVTSNSEWAHPLVCVAKKDGTGKLCVDFRQLKNLKLHVNSLFYFI